MIAGKITSNLPLVRKRYNKFFKKFPRLTKIGLELAGLQLREIILDKTSKGKDTHNRRFPPYSKGYSEAKGKTVVDLYDQGNMLQNFTSKIANKKKVQLFFRSKKEADKAKWHHYGMGKLPVRPFFGYNKKTEVAIRKEFERFMKRQIKALKI
jgi:hypothetical protein